MSVVLLVTPAFAN